MKQNKVMDIFLLLLSVVMVIISIKVDLSKKATLTSDILFYGSLFTSFAAAIIPICSLSFFKFTKGIANQIAYSCSLVLTIVVFASHGSTIYNDIRSFADRGGLWALTTALLLLNFISVNIDENVKIMKDNAKNLNDSKRETIRAKKEIIKEKEKNIQMKEEVINLRKKDKKIQKNHGDE